MHLPSTAAPARRHFCDARAWRIAGVCMWLAWPAAASPVAAADTSTERPAGPCAVTVDEHEVLALLNALRARNASCGSAGDFTQAPPLRWDAALADGANRLARQLATERALTHAPGGASLEDRLRALDYRYQRAAENIAAGPATLDDAAAGWMHSAAHCANLMTPHLRDVGVACATSVDDGTAYWTMVLGTRATDNGITTSLLTR